MSLLAGEIVYEDEIQRKTLETMQWLLNEFNSGAIDRTHYALSMQTLDMATRGLIDQDVSAAIDLEVSRFAADIIEFRVFKIPSKNHLVISRHNRTQGTTRIIQGRLSKEGPVHDHSDNGNSIEEADEGAQELAAKVIDELGGYEL